MTQNPTGLHKVISHCRVLWLRHHGLLHRSMCIPPEAPCWVEEDKVLAADDRSSVYQQLRPHRSNLQTSSRVLWLKDENPFIPFLLTDR